METLSPWLARAAVAGAAIALLAIPALVHRGSGKGVVARRRGLRERVLLALVALGFFSGLTWAATPLFRFADYPLHPAAFGAGIALLLLGLWFLHRSHRDLGDNWSITLEVRHGHRLVTEGVYGHVRHPMYLALLLYGAGQALVLPNWLAGPAYLAALALLVALRIAPEERMMAAAFGASYQAYVARTRRLVPGLW